jgi:hypothetical protein
MSIRNALAKAEISLRQQQSMLRKSREAFACSIIAEAHASSNGNPSDTSLVNPE